MTKRYLKNKKNKTRKIWGGGKNIIIHVAGTQGSGKSTIGNKLLEEYPDKIHVCDLDDLHGDFLSQPHPQSYQKYIDKYIRNHSDKPVIFVGLDAELCLGLMDNSDIYYNLYSKHNYYISSTENTLKQRFFRQIDKLNTRKEYFFDEWMKNPDEIQDKLFRFVDLNKWKENNSKCDELYASRKYEFLSSETIFSRILGILKK